MLIVWRMRQPNDRQATGLLGEDLACLALERLGYAILARRHRTRFGEIDIICRHEGTLVFVEVKARTGTRSGRAAEAIPLWKRRRIGAMALDYLAHVGALEQPCRFDVVAIDGIGSAHEELAVIRDAFVWDGPR